MDYESLIFDSLQSAIPSLFGVFIIVVILDFIRTMIFSEK